MKYVIVLGDGMAGEPLEELGGCTTLEAASTPFLDKLAPVSEQGLAWMVPEGMAPGSDTANLSVLGYNPRECYTGRSPLEALSIGVPLGGTDVAFRCNLVTLSGDGPLETQRILDHSAGEISTEEADVLIQDLKKELEQEHLHFYTGTSYRHLLVWEGGKQEELTPPHDILGETVGPYLPETPQLLEMMQKGRKLLEQHPLNRKRRQEGKNPANSIWFWGAGTRPALESFEKRTGKKGVMISAVDLLKGIAAGTGMERSAVEGTTGGLDTNYRGKALAAVKALTEDGADLAYIHVEAPDEMGHQGNAKDKMTAIERLDREVIQTVAEELEKAGKDFRLLVLPDHPTPVALRTNTAGPVPWLLYDSRKAVKGESTYSEKNAAKTGRNWKEGYRLIRHLCGSQEEENACC